MRRLVRGVAIAAGALVALALTLAVAARFHDGPLGPFPGGRLSGERAPEPPESWRFAAGVREIDLEVSPGSPRSVRTWCLVHADRLYVGAALGARKRWPAQVVADGRVVARIDRRLYPLRAVRVTDAETLAGLRAVATEKYGAPAEGRLAESTWFFRLDPRPVE